MEKLLDQQVQTAENAAAAVQSENGKTANDHHADDHADGGNSREKNETAKSAVKNGTATESPKSSDSPSTGETPQGENQQNVSPAPKNAD